MSRKPLGSAHVDVKKLTTAIEEVFDFIVVGSGAAGAAAAHRLATEGHEVAMVEEGPWVEEYPETAGEAFKGFFRDGGTQALEGRSFIPVLQGRAVGGSTVINSAIAWRTPEDVFDLWRRDYGVDLSRKILDPHFDALEETLHAVRVEDEILGENNARFILATRNIGGAPMRRYDRGCQGSGRCLTGCPNGAKGMDVTLVPDALATGRAVLYSNAACRKVLLLGGRAVGIDAGSHRAPVRLHARHGVILAASTVQTPIILSRSGVGGPQLGAHFQIHPGLAVSARFPDVVRMNVGASQGAESLHYRSEGFKLESIGLPPEVLLARIPGAGPAFAKEADNYETFGTWAAVIRARAEGTVKPSFLGGASIKLSLTERDMHVARKAAATLARLFFEAGAEVVFPGVFGVPSSLSTIDQVRLIEEGPTDSRAYTFIASHLFGATRMAPTAERGVVGTDFAVFGTKGLYVVDSGIFPTNLGVNPQHTIMAVARHAADVIGERLVRRHAA